MTKQKTLIAIAALGILILISVLLAVNSLFSPIDFSRVEVSPNSPARIEIVEGSSLSRVADELAADGILQYPTLFKLWARITGVENSIRTGEYELDISTTPASLLEKIVRGESLQYRITLVEGWTFQQALDAIWEAQNISVSLRDLSSMQIASRMGLDRENPEGALYPETYFYTKGTSDLELLLRANEQLEEVLESAWDSRLGALPYEDPYEALIMASIIEKESASNSERSLISSVFITRLELGMRLQSDPTVIYGMGERYAGNIRREDLSEQTAYNTYRIDGLPPTPIALSGRASIEAALNPSASDFLYFVARGDGSHQFSRTLEEHNAAVRQYQLSSDD